MHANIIHEIKNAHFPYDKTYSGLQGFKGAFRGLTEFTYNKSACHCLWLGSEAFIFGERGRKIGEHEYHDDGAHYLRATRQAAKKFMLCPEVKNKKSLYKGKPMPGEFEEEAFICQGEAIFELETRNIWKGGMIEQSMLIHRVFVAFNEANMKISWARMEAAKLQKLSLLAHKVKPKIL